MLIFGEPGVGKTTFMGTVLDHPDLLPCLWLDIEGGTTPIADKLLHHKSDVDVIPLRTLKKLQETQNLLYMEGDNLPYRSLVVDNMTELQSIDMKVIMREAKANARDPSKIDIDVPSQREWGKSREHMRAITRSLRDLPCHLFTTAHTVDVIKDGQPDRIYPGFGGKAKSDVPGFLNIVGYMTMLTERGKEPEIRIQTIGSKQVLAKDRFKKLDHLLINPTIPAIYETIYGTGESNATS